MVTGSAIDLSETEKAYLAGFLDGEGCIFISKYIYKKRKTRNPSYSLSISVSQTEVSILDYWKDKTELGNIYPQHRVVKGIGETMTYNWVITSRKAGALLRCLYKYLILKKEQADIALRFLDSIVPNNKHLTKDELAFREECYREIMSKKTKNNTYKTKLKLKD